MKHKIIAFIIDNHKEAAVGTGFYVTVFSDITLVGKAIATIFTVVYFGIKIYKELTSK